MTLSNTILSTGNDTKSFSNSKKKICYFMNSSSEGTTGRLLVWPEGIFSRSWVLISALGFVVHQLQSDTDQVLNAEHACGTQKLVINLRRASDLSMSLIGLHLLSPWREWRNQAPCSGSCQTRDLTLVCSGHLHLSTINFNLCTMASQQFLGWAQWLEIIFRKYHGYFPTVTASVPS